MKKTIFIIPLILIYILFGYFLWSSICPLWIKIGFYLTGSACLIGIGILILGICFKEKPRHHWGKLHNDPNDDMAIKNEREKI
jgi:hypothetical protein